jgi:hypothetical protein
MEVPHEYQTLAMSDAGIFPPLYTTDDLICKKLDSGEWDLSTDSFDFYYAKFLKNVTSLQLADGLDVFYKDFRNRKIPTSNGVWLTLNAIAGTPQADLDKMVENFRKNAN